MIPAPISQIVETEVFGAVAHHAECLIGDCQWRSTRRDARKDGEPDARVLADAQRHAETHNDQEG